MIRTATPEDLDDVAARARGCKRIELDVNVDNEAALGLYIARRL
jgi:ribosomal protein S18 acetylase RimI-like enzyme